MDILIVGGGGREHALAWKLRQSRKVSNIFVAPGNAGTAKIAKNLNISRTEDIVAWLGKHRCDLVVVGPDQHLAEGIVDTLESLGIAVFGPTRMAAEIEWSKSFAKQFMHEEGIPTAGYQVFHDIEKAKLYVRKQKFPVVIKASGLALGKGVIIASTMKHAETALDEIMRDKVFGAAGNEVVIEEYMEGREISIHAFCDGEHAVLFPPAQDHKRIFDDDHGPNTGGMGTIASVPWVSQKQMRDIQKQIVIPTIRALKKRGRPFKGILFPGIMITETGPKVIEFNARFGDPETQSYMRILKTDLADILLACVNGKLKNTNIEWSRKSACCIVCASKGYPGAYEKGKIINGININPHEAVIFHAGTKSREDKIVTNGGRVLGVTAVGRNLKTALSEAYQAIKHISFAGMQYREDIGAKSVRIVGR
jgi:phosphoribosylamine--glycine ligase